MDAITKIMREYDERKQFEWFSFYFHQLKKLYLNTDVTIIDSWTKTIIIYEANKSSKNLKKKSTFCILLPFGNKTLPKTKIHLRNTTHDITKQQQQQHQSWRLTISSCFYVGHQGHEGHGCCDELHDCFVSSTGVADHTATVAQFITPMMMMTMMVVSMVEAFRKPRRCFSPILSNANGRKWPNWPSGGAFLLVDFGFFNDGRFWLFRFRKSIWCRCDKSSFEIFGELILRVSLWKSRFREKWLVLRCLYNI